MHTIRRQFRIPFLVAFAGFLAPGVSLGDTLGLPPPTAFEKEWRADRTALKGQRILVARSAEEWAALWKKHAPKEKEAPAVDFRTHMVVGVATPKGQTPRAVYRVELNDAAAPKELLVRVTFDDAICQKPREVRIKGARIHLVVTAKSALPVRFIQDAMTYPRGPLDWEGVDPKPLGTVAGLKGGAGKARAAYREQAEKLVRDSLTKAEVARLKKGLQAGPFGDRYPQLWSVVRVRRLARTWAIEYDGLSFRVNAATGAVTRVRPKGAPVPDAWSAPVKGLSGRLRVVWLRQGNTLRPEVTAELKNVEPAKSLAVSNRFRLEARIHDETGKEIKVEPMIGFRTHLVREQWGVVPAGAFLGYPADERCTGSKTEHQWSPGGKVLVLGGMGQWTLPPGRYVVSARLTAGESKVPPPPAATRWEGTLTLPPVEVVVPEGVGATKPGDHDKAKAAKANEQDKAKAIEALDKLGVPRQYLPFQGQWRVVSMKDAKGQTSDVPEILVTVRGMKFELSGPGVRKDLPMPLEFRVHATKKDNPYRAYQEEGVKNSIEVFWYAGIYKLSGDELHLALKYCGQGVEGAAARNYRLPSSFHKKPMDGEIRIILKRQVSLDDLPDLQAATYRVDPYIRAAAALQEMGKAKARDTLSKLAKSREHDKQVIVLCRMLFTRKAKGEFRRPALGAAVFLGGTDYADWPLEPIELVDGVPFLITRGYDIGGEPERAEVYLKYCLRNCDWNSLRFKPKDDKEKQKALKKFLASPKWKAKLDDAAKAFLSSQIR